MAITPDAMQAELGLNPLDARVVRADEVEGEDATKQGWLVAGNVAAPGRMRWCVTAAADNAATQAASVLTQLRA